MPTLAERLFSTKKHQIMMLQARGYEVPDAAILDFTQDQFNTYYQGSIPKLTSQIIPKEGSKKKPLLVWYIETLDKDVPVADVRQLAAFLTDEHGQTRIFSHTIIISDQKLGTPAAQTLAEMPAFEVEHFRFDELSYNPTEHFLQSTFHRLSKNQAKAFFEAMSYVHPSQMPTMYTTDPVAKYYHYQHGDLIMIIRHAVIKQTPEKEVFYRIVKDVKK